MQRTVKLILISKQESFVKSIIEFCKKHSIEAKSYSFVPKFNDPTALVLLDIDSIGEDSLGKIKNRVICLTNEFESKDHLKKLLKAGAMFIKPLRADTVTSSLTSYYDRVGQTA